MIRLHHGRRHGRLLVLHSLTLWLWRWPLPLRRWETLSPKPLPLPQERHLVGQPLAVIQAHYRAHRRGPRGKGIRR